MKTQGCESYPQGTFLDFYKYYSNIRISILNIIQNWKNNVMCNRA